MDEQSDKPEKLKTIHMIRMSCKDMMVLLDDHVQVIMKR